VFFSALIGWIADWWQRRSKRTEQRSQRENLDDIE
jgi:hypothetical protein